MFTLAEVIALAMRIEENGEAFYHDAVEKFQDPSIKRVLERMAAEEAEHAHWFASLGSARRRQVADAPLEAMSRMLLREVVGGQRFSLTEERLSGVTGSEDMLALMIEFEEDTVRFYEMLYDFVTEEATRQGLERIIAEEKQHARQLRNLLPAS
jgi:rubrerythrin